MGSRFQFELMSTAEAHAVQALTTDQGEIFNDKVRAHRRLQPVTDPREALAAHRYNVEYKKWEAGEGPHPCDGVTWGPLPVTARGYGVGPPTPDQQRKPDTAR